MNKTVEHATIMETTSRDILRSIFDYKYVILVCSFILIPFVYIKQEMVTPRYVASVKLMVSGVKETDSDFYRGAFPGGSGLTSSLVQLAKSKIVLKRVVNYLKLYERPLDFDEMRGASMIKKYVIENNIEKLKSNLDEMTPEQRKVFLFDRAMTYLSDNISSYEIEGTNLFMLNVKDYNPSVAVVLANSLSRSYIIFDLEQKLAELTLKYGEKHSVVVQLRNYIKSIYETLHGKPLPDIEAMGPASVKVIQQAEIIAIEGKDKKRVGLALAFLIGLFGGIAIAYGLDYFSQMFKTHHDVEKYLGIPFLGSIPKIKSNDKLIINNSNPKDEYVHFYRNISIHLDRLMRLKNSRSILISDAEGSAYTANVVANIGYCLADQVKHCSILIIDANLRNPMISNVLNIAEAPGLTDLIEGTVSFENTVQDAGFNVNVISAGKSVNNISAVLNSPEMKDLIKKAQEAYELVIVLCSDLKLYQDAADLASLTDAFVLMLDAETVRRVIAKMAIVPLEKNEVQILGAILYNRKMKIPKVIYKWI